MVISQKVKDFVSTICVILLFYENECIARFSDLH